MRKLLVLLALLATSLQAQGVERKTRTRAVVEDSVCAPGFGWETRPERYTTIAAANTAARVKKTCPVVVPPVDTTPVPPPVVVPPLPPAGGFLESFTGQPAAPQPFTSSSLWDVQRYLRDRVEWFAPTPMDALHGHDCAAPPATHTMASFDGMAFTCRDHVMTAVNSPSYGVVILTPARMIDFTAQAETISVNLSTKRTHWRDWLAFWITPWGDNLALPAKPDAPGLNGPPRNGVYVEQTTDGNLCPKVVRDFIVTALPCSDWPAVEQRIPPSMTTRLPVVVVISRTHVKVSWNGVVFADADFPQPLAFTQAVVQFGHYSYNPTKDCAPGGGCGPNTWHWDEVRLSRAVPFTMIHGDVRTVSTNGGGITFSAPAPAGAFLRFSVSGMWPEVSVNNGASWQLATLQGFARVSDPEAQYFHPIPAGTRRVLFRASRPLAWWTETNSWLVRDVSIWSR